MMSVPFGGKERTREIFGAWASEGVLGEKDLSSKRSMGSQTASPSGADMEVTVWQYNVKTALHRVAAWF